MQTPETKLKARVKALMKEAHAYWHMPVQAGLGAPALDFHVNHRGFYAGIETKAPGKRPTPRQIATATEIIKAGGVVFFIDGDTTQLANWLKFPHKGPWLYTSWKKGDLNVRND